MKVEFVPTYTFTYLDNKGKTVIHEQEMTIDSNIHDVVELFVSFLKGVGYSPISIDSGFAEAELDI